MTKFYQRIALLLTFILLMHSGFTQGVTTSSMTGIVTDPQKGKAGLQGATVAALHTPSGTTYSTVTNSDGRYTIPNMRVGGPYTVTVSYVGFQPQEVSSVELNLGTAATLNFQMSEQASTLTEVVITGRRSNVFSSGRTGAATNISREAINALPTLSRSINDFTRLTPQASGRSFGGQDNRLNNITIDGSILNSSFGLADQPGGRTGSTPISLDAIEQISVNIAPYDVRQSGFTGAGINAVTRSGTNNFTGSVFYNVQNDKLVGKTAKGTNVITNDFTNKQAGFRFGGPIIKNKLFFFVNGELERRTDPATQFRANNGGEPVQGNVTRVLASDLKQFSDYLKTNFGYETGPYQDYNNTRSSDKILVKLDYNINQKHKASIRYNTLTSQQDVLVSTGGSTSGNRRGNLDALTFQNSNYVQLEKIHSVIGELNSAFHSKLSNNLIIGYTYQDEGRKSKGQFFPLVEILNGGLTYMTAGYEPYTYNNEVRYSTLQLQDNLTYYAGKHTLTGGLNIERLRFFNTFIQTGSGIYTYNSMDDFYAAANAYLSNPEATTSPDTLVRFQQQYSALPSNAKPTSITKLTYTGLYFQDSWAPRSNITVTAGLRADVPFFEKTGLSNEAVAAMTFNDEKGNPLQVRTDKMPDPKILWSPRAGFNWDVFSNKTLQLRGGTGIFTGRPPFVWIGNQIGQNGVLLGTTDVRNTTAIPFNPDPIANYPANPTLPPTYQVNITDVNFKFPQVWRSNIGADKTLFAGIVGTVEFIYNKNINDVSYLNINQVQTTSTFLGPDNRLRYPGAALNRLNPAITGNYYLTNNSKGYSYTLTTQLEKTFGKGWYAKAAYNFGTAKDIMSSGSTAAGSYNSILSVNGSNYPEIAFSNNDQRHRIISAVSYRKEYAGFGATQISVFFEARNQGRFSYAYSGDMNGDNISGNDLLFVPSKASDLTFVPIAINGTTLFTPEQQATAFDNYIEQDSYLKNRRGQYTERNGVVMPWVARADFSIVQEFFVRAGGKRNTFQLRADIFNFTNMINSNWGAGKRFISSSPLISAGANPEGVPQYRMATLGSGATQSLLNTTYQNSATQTDIWTAQFGMRYIFN